VKKVKKETIPKITLGLANKLDSRDLWEWRNHLQVRKYSFNKKIISWEEHEKWFFKKLKDENSIIYIISDHDGGIGVIRFEQEKDYANININLNPKYIGQGFGVLAIKKGTKKYINYIGRIQPIFAHIKKENTRSIKAFKRSGYKLKSKNKDELVYCFPIRKQ